MLGVIVLIIWIRTMEAMEASGIEGRGKPEKPAKTRRQPDFLPRLSGTLLNSMGH